MSSYYKIPKEYYIYDKASDFGKVISTYFLYENDIENKNPVDFAIDLYNIKQELEALEDERVIREYLKLAKLLRKLGQL